MRFLSSEALVPGQPVSQNARFVVKERRSTHNNSMFRSKYLRQSILLSRYETPEFRSLFNRSLYNVEGKIRVERTDFEGVLGGVRKGVKQVFTRLKGEDALEELEARFKFFTQTVSTFYRSITRLTLTSFLS